MLALIPERHIMTEEQKSAPRFVGGAARVKTVPLAWPVEYDGKVYDEITIKRLTAREVADFSEKLEKEKNGALRWPVFVDGEGAPIPDVVLDAIDDDDNLEIQKALIDFLPRRFRGGAEASEQESRSA
jgi:hypothetical protein